MKINEYSRSGKTVKSHKRGKNRYFISILTGVSFGLAVVGTFAMASEYHYQLNAYLKPVQHVTASAEQSVKDYVLDEVSKAGIDPYEAYAIINCESRWDTQAINVNSKHGSVDLGLWQINNIFQKVTPECSVDYRCATSKAIEIYKSRGNWSAWSCANKLGIK